MLATVTLSFSVQTAHARHHSEARSSDLVSKNIFLRNCLQGTKNGSFFYSSYALVAQRKSAGLPIRRLRFRNSSSAYLMEGHQIGLTQAVLKTVAPKGLVGSIPTPSAKGKFRPSFVWLQYKQNAKNWKSYRDWIKFKVLERDNNARVALQVNLRGSP